MPRTSDGEAEIHCRLKPVRASLLFRMEKITMRKILKAIT